MGTVCVSGSEPGSGMLRNGGGWERERDGRGGLALRVEEGGYGVEAEVVVGVGVGAGFFGVAGVPAGFGHCCGCVRCLDVRGW